MSTKIIINLIKMDRIQRSDYNFCIKIFDIGKIDVMKIATVEWPLLCGQVQCAPLDIKKYRLIHWCIR